MPADKTTRFYRMDIKGYKELNNDITKGYKKANCNLVTSIIMKQNLSLKAWILTTEYVKW